MRYFNVASASTHGIEVALDVDVVPDWARLKLAYTNLRAIDLETRLSLQRRPEHAALAALAITPVSNWLIEPRLYLFSERFSSANETNRLSLRAPRPLLATIASTRHGAYSPGWITPPIPATRRSSTTARPGARCSAVSAPRGDDERHPQPLHPEDAPFRARVSKDGHRQGPSSGPSFETQPSQKRRALRMRQKGSQPPSMWAAAAASRHRLREGGCEALQVRLVGQQAEAQEVGPVVNDGPDPCAKRHDAESRHSA